VSSLPSYEEAIAKINDYYIIAFLTMDDQQLFDCVIAFVQGFSRYGSLAEIAPPLTDQQKLRLYSL